MEIFSNHKKLYGVAFLFFVGLSVLVAILPAINNDKNNAPLPGSENLTEEELAGKLVFIANGCVACHTQQVRNVDMDKNWGQRPSVAADYANNKRMNWWMNTATLMGTERTGPDLTNIGNRLPSAEWHLLHLYNPRAVMDESIMPAYPWMFEWKDTLSADDKEVNVPAEFTNGKKGKVVATKEAMQLVAYLQSLKQTSVPDGTAVPPFLYERKSNKVEESKSSKPAALDGALLYSNNCQACHQANGEGLKGAFPPLKGSAIVLDDNPEIFIDITMNGYNAREEFAEMPAVGINNGLRPEEITAIINHERTTWGNNARALSVAEVEKIMTYLKSQNTNQ
jgi:cytochrome c oxidase cbb3-type subunit II